jgi:hypothetical protein
MTRSHDVTCSGPAATRRVRSRRQKEAAPTAVSRSWTRLCQLLATGDEFVPFPRPSFVVPQGDRRHRLCYLNGFWTVEHCLEQDLIERYPDDTWARSGARNAARDLLDIQRMAAHLMASQRASTEAFLVTAQSSRRLRNLLGEPGFADDPGDGGNAGADRLYRDCVMFIDRISDYLGGLHAAGRATRPALAEDPR